jgi:hypothetical protein
VRAVLTGLVRDVARGAAEAQPPPPKRPRGAPTAKQVGKECTKALDGIIATLEEEAATSARRTCPSATCPSAHSSH